MFPLDDFKHPRRTNLPRANLFDLPDISLPALADEPLAWSQALPSAPWWSQTGSNRRPQACKASALPTELWPLLKSGLLMVGREGVEPSTSRLSGVRSNHLSYRPPCLPAVWPQAA